MLNSFVKIKTFQFHQKKKKIYTSVSGEQIHGQNFPLMNSQIFYLYVLLRWHWTLVNINVDKSTF